MRGRGLSLEQISAVETQFKIIRNEISNEKIHKKKHSFYLSNDITLLP